MNDKTEQLLRDLADKLGTTTEYLWNVLITQAKYDAITSAVQMVFMAIIIITTIKLHLKFNKKVIPYEGYGGSKLISAYQDREESLIIPMIFAGVVSGVLIIFFLSGFNELISAIFNPEYWALNRILHFVR